MVLKTDYVDGDIFYAGSVNEIGTTVNAHAGSLSNLGVGYHRVISGGQGLIQRDTDDIYDIIGSITLPAGSLTTYAECRAEIYSSTSLATIGDRKWSYRYKITSWSDAGSVDLVNNENFWNCTGSSNTSNIFWTHALYTTADLAAGSAIKFVVQGAIEEVSGTSGSGIMTLRSLNMEVWGI